MSKMELKKEIERMNKELCTLIKLYNYDLQRPIIIKVSQRLDKLISDYIKIH